ncbi:hypothetical protein NPIL_210081 [Nephila pilipes]|uniref:Thyroid transcription factor 1-associated protein 26 n=1 Tax=Nephila pilipes TaxID=299642 RepID=A0A8X6PFY6_NEPPI|nr:hypothetical protein NPIL_210081 [Nephila pilipes]
MPNFRRNYQNKKKEAFERRKYAIKREYRKMQVGKGGQSFHPRQNRPNDNNGSQFYRRAMQEYERNRAAIEERKQIKEAKRKEREEAITRYKEKKLENFKKLSQRTKRGQPVMKGRLEILLEKIKKTVNNDCETVNNTGTTSYKRKIGNSFRKN